LVTFASELQSPLGDSIARLRELKARVGHERKRAVPLLRERHSPGAAARFFVR
jgi:hypothetical protein